MAGQRLRPDSGTLTAMCVAVYLGPDGPLGLAAAAEADAWPGGDFAPMTTPLRLRGLRTHAGASTMTGRQAWLTIGVAAMATGRRGWGAGGTTGPAGRPRSPIQTSGVHCGPGLTPTSFEGATLP